ncbi:hypothetical protein F2P81_019937 [Scophthalmus maximus]|uniref:Uncharacterized protein n=1 Tax=Scophthalmus maximus TaxID=52904 RepID=A0A6A4RWM2_SCOMX|nr:hypothetical protein F2P81_019937 [Scophthalmus maximus]
MARLKWTNLDSRKDPYICIVTLLAATFHILNADIAARLSCRPGVTLQREETAVVDVCNLCPETVKSKEQWPLVLFYASKPFYFS